ncbi:MAG: DUF2752 domain-containing protein [Chloroflexota bacterium]
MANTTWLQKGFDQGAVLSKLIKDRAVCITITSFAAVQTGLTYFGMNGWICPFRHYLSCPCPGCGLTRASVAMVKGDFKEMLAYHALAPFFLVGLILIALGAILPSGLRERLILFVERIEVKTGLGIIFCGVLIAYWLIRLLFFTNSYMNLVMS